MPSKSMYQYRLMQAAKHGAKFPMAEKVRESMTAKQLDEFTAKKPARKAHVRKGK